MFVLIVDDDILVRTVHIAAIARIPGVSVVAVGTVSEARSVLGHATPDVLLLDLNLPDGNGLDVIDDLAQRGLSLRVVVISAHIDAYRAQLLPNAALTLLPKPAPASELRRLVQARAKETLPPPFTLIDYIQLACMGQHSVELVGEGPAASASVVVRDGQLWAARDSEGGGVAALERLAGAAQPGLRVRGVDPSADISRNIEERWDHVLLELMRLRDEASPARRESDPGQEADLDAVPVSVPAGLDFDAYVERAVKAIVARDYVAAERALGLAHELRPDDRLVLHRLEKLRRPR
jgi:DNA-binding response OmpR family regulator